MIKAVRDWVVVKLRYKEQTGSIVIPDSAQQYSGDFYGEVVSIGPDYKYDLKTGDKIAFVRHEGFKIFDKDGEEYLSLRERWVLGKIEED